MTQTDTSITHAEVNGGRGWKGDVKNMLLDIGKIKTLGWKPKHNTARAIQNTGMG
jgi:UDP-glucose 4-epimerase